MIRVSIGRIIRWFLDAAQDADRLHKGHIRDSPVMPSSMLVTDGPIKKIDIGPRGVVLRKPMDTPLRSN